MNFRQLGSVGLIAMMSIAAQPAFAAKKKDTAHHDEQISSSQSASTHASQSNAVNPLTQPGFLTSGADKGISFSFPNGGNAGIGGSYFLDDDHSLRMEVGMEFNKTSADNTFGLSLDIGYRTYVKKVSMIKVYSQPNFFIAKATTGGANLFDRMVFAPGYAVGAEFFLNQNVSLGVSTGLALTFKDGFDTIKLATGTSAITANYYF